MDRHPRIHRAINKENGIPLELFSFISPNESDAKNQSKSHPKRRLTYSFLAAIGLLLALTLPCCTPSFAYAAPSTITGTCYIECTNPHINGSAGGNLFLVRFPTYGIETTGFCTSGPLYGTPLPGHYPFTGTLNSDGSYAIDINTAGAGMYDNHYSPLGPQRVGGFSLYFKGALGVHKKSARPDITQGSSAYSLEGGVYGIFSERECTQLIGTITTNSEGAGESEKNLLPGTYWIKELTAPAGFALSDAVSEVVLSLDNCMKGEVSFASVEDEPQLVPASLVIEKKDGETGLNTPQGEGALAGAVFRVEHFNESITSPDEIVSRGLAPTNSQTIITQNDGRASIDPISLPTNSGGSGYPLGSLVITEILAPPGYLLPDNPTQIRILTGEGTQPLTPLFLPSAVDEQAIRGDIAIKKVGSLEGSVGDDAPKVPLEGIAFDLIRATDNTVAARLITDHNGFASTANLPGAPSGGALVYGTYLVREDPSTIPAGYDAVSEFMVTIAEHNKELTYRLDDTTGTYLRIEKRDSETCEIIRGITQFELHDGAGNIVSFPGATPQDEPQTLFTTNEEGYCVLPDKLNGGGTYYLKEITAPYGYVIEPSLMPFSLELNKGRNPDEPFVITLNNNPQKGSLLVQKTQTTGEALQAENICWEVRAQNDIITADGTLRVAAGEIVGNLISDESGVARIDNLYPGVYEVVETQAPAGYVRQTEALVVEIAYGDQTLCTTKTEVAFPNKPITGQILLHKADRQTGNHVAGATYDLRAAETIVSPDGLMVLYEKGTVLDTLRTNDEGCAESVEVPLGHYEVVETEAPAGYELDSEPHAVTITANDQDIPVVEVRVEVSDNQTSEKPAQKDSKLAKTGDAPLACSMGIVGSTAIAAIAIGLLARYKMRQTSR